MVAFLYNPSDEVVVIACGHLLSSLLSLIFMSDVVRELSSIGDDTPPLPFCYCPQ